MDIFQKGIKSARDYGFSMVDFLLPNKGFTWHYKLWTFQKVAHSSRMEYCVELIWIFKSIKSARNLLRRFFQEIRFRHDHMDDSKHKIINSERKSHEICKTTLHKEVRTLQYILQTMSSCASNWKSCSDIKSCYMMRFERVQAIYLFAYISRESERKSGETWKKSIFIFPLKSICVDSHRIPGWRSQFLFFLPLSNLFISTHQNSQDNVCCFSLFFPRILLSACMCVCLCVCTCAFVR